MDAQEFREFAKAAIDYVADYSENIRDRQVLPSVEPGYLQNMIPSDIPEKAEKWQDVMKDMERVIMPGITHWQSPNFHAYYPTGLSYASIVGELLSNGLGIIGFSWITSPACTELEVAMMNWLGKLIELPTEFLNCSDGPGGGIIQGSASEATLVGLLAAKQRSVRRLLEENPDMEESTIKPKLVAYTSNQSNSSVEKAGILGSMPMRLLNVDKECSLRGETLREAVEKDIAAGLIPCYLVATLGTTGTCAFDNLDELAEVCKEYNIWLHIDAAYAGAAFICPEYRHYMKGIEKADSFNMNVHKWLLVNFDCSPMWVKDANYLIDAFNVDRIYLKHHHDQNKVAPDYRHWQIPLGRRFRALKLWTVFRLYGSEGLQNHIRKHCGLAERFASHVRTDSRFEICPEPIFGLVCFRIKGDDELSKSLHEKLMERKNIYLVPATYDGAYILRFVVCGPTSEEKDIDYAWTEIQSLTNDILGNDVKTIEYNTPLIKPPVTDNGKFHISETCTNNEPLTSEKYK